MLTKPSRSCACFANIKTQELTTSATAAAKAKDRATTPVQRVLPSSAGRIRWMGSQPEHTTVEVRSAYLYESDHAEYQHV